MVQAFLSPVANSRRVAARTYSTHHNVKRPAQNSPQPATVCHQVSGSWDLLPFRSTPRVLSFMRADWRMGSDKYGPGRSLFCRRDAVMECRCSASSRELELHAHRCLGLIKAPAHLFGLDDAQ